RLRDARRRRSLRGLVSPRLPHVCARPPRRVRRLVRALLGGLPLTAGVLEEDRPRPPERLVHGGLLLGRRGRDDSPPVPAGHGPARSGGLGAVARLGSRADGALARGRAARDASDLDRRGPLGRAAPRPRRGGVPPGARRPRRDRRPLRALRRRPWRHRVPLPPEPSIPVRAPRALAPP